MNIKRYSIIMGIFCLAFGSAMHFFYEWTDGNRLIGLIAPVNESPWEHLKLLFYPLLLSMIITIIFIKSLRKITLPYTFAMASIIAMGTTLVLYFLYWGIFGEDFMILDLIIYLIAVVLSWMYIYYYINNENVSWQKTNCALGISIFVVFIVLFALLSYYPIEISLFRDPAHNIYGPIKY